MTARRGLTPPAWSLGLTRDPVTGALYRRFSHTTLEERGKIAVEFEEDVVTAIEHSENIPGTKTRIIVPPVVFHW